MLKSEFKIPFGAISICFSLFLLKEVIGTEIAYMLTMLILSGGSLISRLEEEKAKIQKTGKDTWLRAFFVSVVGISAVYSAFVVLTSF